MQVISLGLNKYIDFLFHSFEKDIVIEPSTNNQNHQNKINLTDITTFKNKLLELSNFKQNPVEMSSLFEFKQETFIKLNNIAYCLVELDKLENSSQSEKQAGLLENNHLYSLKREDLTNHMFTIEILEARGLKSCDRNGLSDPYLILFLNTEEIGRTQTIYKTLNPVWNNIFEFSTFSSCKLMFRIWDENLIMDHTLCGTTAMNIDPMNFKDFVSRDFWIDVKPKGQLHISLSMETEKEDIRFFFGKSYRKLMKTEEQMIQLIVNKFQGVIANVISRDGLKSLAISRAKKTNNQEVINHFYDFRGFFGMNFQTLGQNLKNDDLKLKIGITIWNYVLSALESIVFPPLSNEPSKIKPLSNNEQEILLIWDKLLSDFFYNDGTGVPMDVIDSPRHQGFVNAIKNLYNKSAKELIGMVEVISGERFNALKKKRLYMAEIIRRSNTIMAHRNRKSMKEARDSIQNAEAQASDQELIILKILKGKGENLFVEKRMKQLGKIPIISPAMSFIG